ncbi:hypothetical protein [Microcoleus sp. FACHB-SPT15]|nr:hypothetical protein [Microcoleus sp. FACHB-SPT15]
MRSHPHQLPSIQEGMGKREVRSLMHSDFQQPKVFLQIVGEIEG